MAAQPIIERSPSALGSLSKAASAIALSVVVPCYNQENVLRELHRRTSQACRSFAAEKYEIILVDDGSRDETWQSIQPLAPPIQTVVGVKLSRNYGHQNALSA